METRPVGHPEKGSLLVLILVLLALGTGVISILSTQLGTRLHISRVFKTKVTLELAAEGGIALAKNDLRNRALDPQGFTQSIEYKGETLDPIDVGLLRPDPNTPRQAVPRFWTRDEVIETKVWYFPDPSNPGEPGNLSDPEHNLAYPKRFRVVSKAEHLRTGKSYTFEALFHLRLESLAEISFGMIDPTLPPGFSEFPFRPANYSGHVHFGSFHPTFLKKDGSDDPPHRFKDHVTFGADSIEGQEEPFIFDENHTELIFERAYTKNRAFEWDANYLIDSAKANRNAPFNENEELCLTFVRDSIEKYECKKNEAGEEDITANVWQRYVGEVEVLSNGTINVGVDPQEIVPIPDSGMVIYSTKNIHVKGRLSKKVTVVSEQNVVIEGDIQYTTQDTENHPTKNVFGALARKNIEIPAVVPMNFGRWNAIDYADHEQGDATNNIFPHNEVSNFTVAEDRDIEEGSGYIENGKPWESYLGEIRDNRMSVLDLDGTYVAAEGGLDVKSLNDYEHSSNGVVIPGKDGKIYSSDIRDAADDSAGNADGKEFFYTFDEVVDVDDDGNPVTNIVITGRKNDPVVCANRLEANGACPFFAEERQQWADKYNGGVVKDCSDASVTCEYWARNEAPRGRMADIWLYGGLITKDFSFTAREIGGQMFGFKRRVINYNPGLGAVQPPSFPTLDNVLIETIYRKSYPGSSELLAQF